MATITIDEQALQNADAFLASYLSERIPEADFSKGSATRDFVVTALALVFAFLEQERKTTRDQQSLLKLSQQADSESVRDAVNAILSNLFIARKDGLKARTPVTMHFSAASDITLAPTTRFFKTADIVFVPDAADAFVIPANTLIPVYNASNVVVDYTTTVNLISLNVGTAYNVPAGRFVGADQFNPFFTYAENPSDVIDGKNIESTQEVLARAPTALSVRNLVNVRSIDTVLRDTFAEVSRVLSVGFGEAEMLRDFATEAVTHLQMHVGGFADIYVHMPVTEVVETAVLGGSMTRPDGVMARLIDTGPGVDFTAGTPVAPGDVLRVTAGLVDAPREYIVSAVEANALTVNPRASFSAATEEAGDYVTYSVGTIAPGYSNRRASSTTGQTSRAIQTDDAITLRGRPHYRISKVEVFDPGAPQAITYLTSRVNTVPGAGEYRVVNLVPANGQSAYAVDQLQLSPGQFTAGWSVRVTYDTLAGYDAVQAFVVDRFERVLASNPLVKGYNPVYLTLSIAYRLRSSATAQLDETAAKQGLAEFINTFDLTTALDMTAILQYLRDNFPELGVVVGIPALTYDLLAPDGQVYSYVTDDIVTVRPDYPHNNANLTNGMGLRTPISNAALDPAIPANEPLFAAANATLRDQLTALGVSDRTLRFRTRADDISLTQVA